MCLWAEDAGATVGATVVQAARAEAWRTAFCIATDATGVAVQPLRRPDKKRQACRRGHFFVLIADRDHIFFEYTPKETSLFVAGMLRGAIRATCRPTPRASTTCSSASPAS